MFGRFRHTTKTWGRYEFTYYPGDTSYYFHRSKMVRGVWTIDFWRFRVQRYAFV